MDFILFLDCFGIYLNKIAMGRIGWIPFKDKIIKILSGNNSDESKTITFDISYKIPIFGM